MWEKEFAPYELAVKLKELGFKRTCLAEYIDGIFYLSTSLNNKKQVLTTASAPLWQQVEDWFLKEHYLYGIVIPTSTMHWTYKIIAMDGDVVEEPPYKDVNGADYSTKEDAREAMFKEMLTMIK